MMGGAEKTAVLSSLSPLPTRRVWRGLVILIALLGLLLSACLTDSADASADYDPHEVVYDQPLHGIYETGSSRTSVAYPPAGDPQPHIEVARGYADFGSLALGQQAEHTFVVRNTGDATLTITRLYTTCDYLVADLTGSVIPPQRIALLIVKMDLTGNPHADSGLVRRGAILESNDPQRPE